MILQDQPNPHTLSAIVSYPTGWALEQLEARLAQSVEHETLNLRVVGSSPTLGVTCFAGCLKPSLHLILPVNTMFAVRTLPALNNQLPALTTQISLKYHITI